MDVDYEVPTVNCYCINILRQTAEVQKGDLVDFTWEDYPSYPTFSSLVRHIQGYKNTISPTQSV